jgi:hypothetical protein
VQSLGYTDQTTQQNISTYTVGSTKQPKMNNTMNINNTKKAICTVGGLGRVRPWGDKTTMGQHLRIIREIAVEMRNKGEGFLNFCEQCRRRVGRSDSHLNSNMEKAWKEARGVQRLTAFYSSQERGKEESLDEVDTDKYSSYPRRLNETP